jgi:hypothetical protein
MAMAIAFSWDRADENRMVKDFLVRLSNLSKSGDPLGCNGMLSNGAKATNGRHSHMDKL